MELVCYCLLSALLTRGQGQEQVLQYEYCRPTSISQGATAVPTRGCERWSWPTIGTVWQPGPNDTTSGPMTAPCHPGPRWCASPKSPGAGWRKATARPDRVVGAGPMYLGLTPKAKRYVAQQGPLNTDTLVAWLENNQVLGKMMRADRPLKTKTQPKAVSRCVFGVGSCLVGNVYSRGLVLFWASLPVSRLHSWSPVMSVSFILKPLFRLDPPTFVDCFRVYAVSTSASFHLV